MHYTSNSELPPDIRHELPKEAQDLYREIFNQNFPSSRRAIDSTSEQVAHEAAWRAVSGAFELKGGKWSKK